MKSSDSLNMHRRRFLASSSLMMLGVPFLSASALPGQNIKGPDLPEELSPQEKEIVAGSAMANDVGNFFGKGYSCAESGLAVGLRYLKKPEELIWMAGGFGGGLYHRDLCGFLTGGIMSIGLYAGMLDLERKEAHRICTEKVNRYWTWWVATAPLHCAEIRAGHKDLKVCHRIGSLAAAKVEELIRA